MHAAQGLPGRNDLIGLLRVSRSSSYTVSGVIRPDICRREDVFPYFGSRGLLGCFGLGPSNNAVAPLLFRLVQSLVRQLEQVEEFFAFG